MRRGDTALLNLRAVRQGALQVHVGSLVAFLCCDDAVGPTTTMKHPALRACAAFQASCEVDRPESPLAPAPVQQGQVSISGLALETAISQSEIALVKTHASCSDQSGTDNEFDILDLQARHIAIVTLPRRAPRETHYAMWW